jgi:toxin ParE1/3/4
VARVRITRPARLDLLDIVTWMTRHAGAARAAAFAHDLRARCELFAEHPLAGPAREDLGRDVRLFPFGDYVVLYRVVGEQVRVERIVRGMRDLRRLGPDISDD